MIMLRIDKYNYAKSYSYDYGIKENEGGDRGRPYDFTYYATI